MSLIARLFKGKPKQEWVVVTQGPLKVIGAFSSAQAASLYAQEQAPGEFGVQGQVTTLDAPAKVVLGN